MTYALDANTISYLLRRDRNPEVAVRFAEAINLRHKYVIPPLSYYEVLWYLLRKSATTQLVYFSELYDKALVKIKMDEADIIAAAKLRAEMDRQGNPIGDSDILIAAYCLINGYVLVTNNIKHFEHIENLRIENWL